nr:hypothetical protein CFP56_15623 [Quercus suber]
MECEKGNNVNQGGYPDFQQHIHVTAGKTEVNVERGVMGEVAEVNHELMLKGRDESAKLKGDGKEVNGLDGTSIRPKPKWTRFVHMESGPVSSDGNNSKEQLGKRKAMQYTKEGNYEDLDVMVLKQQKGPKYETESKKCFYITGAVGWCFCLDDVDLKVGNFVIFLTL